MRRFTFSRNQKIVFWLAVLVLLWRGLSDPFVVEAVLTFGLTGHVPGTAAILSPDTVMLLSAGLVVIIMVAIAIRRKPQPSKVVAMAQSQSVAAGHPVVRPMIHQHSVTPRQLITAKPLVRHRTWMGRIGHQLLVRALDLPGVIWAGVSPHLWKFDAWLGAWFHYFMRKMHRKMQANDKASVLLDFARYGKRKMPVLKRPSSTPAAMGRRAK